ncbi:MAG: phosphatidylglycerophosphatase A [Sphingobacteriaceae bacterium]|nr:phosphatidylglycerophosphatase A [Sphingobacteriaceae bacterium]
MIFWNWFYKKGAGTVASLITCGFIYLYVTFHLYSNIRFLFLNLVLFIIGVFVSKEAEKSWGKDSNKIVIDEVFGMTISLLFLPINFITIVIAFVLFRFFDILKPLGIRKAEKLKNGWGVMVDDLVAGIYSNIIIQILIITNIIK